MYICKILKTLKIKKNQIDIDIVPHPWRGDNQGQETFLAPYADNKTCNYNTVLQPPSLPINTKVKRIEMWEGEMVSYIHTNLPVYMYIHYICIHFIFILFLNY